MKANQSGQSLSSDLTIRPATVGDKPGIWVILKPIFRAGDTYAVDPDICETDALIYWTRARCFVAVDDGRVIGTYYLKRNQAGRGSHICNCGYATSVEAQGKGVARAMLEHSLTTAKEVGFEAMQFNFVLASNERAIDIWRRAGFSEIGRIPEAFDHPKDGLIDALILHKPLH